MYDRHERASELLAGFSLDALDIREQSLVQQHLDEGCRDCGHDMTSLRRVTNLLAFATQPVNVNPELKRRIMSQVAPSGWAGHR